MLHLTHGDGGRVGMAYTLSNLIMMIIRERSSPFHTDLFGFPGHLGILCFFDWLAARSDFESRKFEEGEITYISWCFMSKGSSKDVDYLMLHCPVATRSWMVINWFGFFFFFLTIGN